MTEVGKIPAGAIDLGEGHWITLSRYEDEISGLSDYHLTPEGKVCAGFIAFEGRAWARKFADGLAGHAWKVECEDPLTLSPSLLCRACGDHGFIRNGRWVRA